MSFRAVFFTILILVVIVVIGAGIYLWYQASISRGLDIKLTIPSEIRAGISFDLKVDISNDSKNILEDAELLIELPPETAFVGSIPDKVIHSKKLGNLGSGSLTQEGFELIVLGGVNTVKEIKAKVSYLPDTLGSRFEKNKRVSFSVIESSISFDLSLPRKVFSGEEFETKISYKNVSDRDFSDLRIKVNYPPLFTFKSASSKPDFGNNGWQLKELGRGKAGELVIRGELAGPDQGFFDIESEMQINLLGRSYTIAKKSASISIAASPLSLAIDLNNNPSYIARPGEELTYTLSFKNNTDIGLKDVIVRAKLIGELFDFATLRADASLEIGNTLVWNTANSRFLSVIEPGEAGSVQFVLETRKSYPIRRLSDKNFTLKVEAEIESATVPYFIAARKTLTLAELTTKVGGELQIDVKGLFRDAASGILNKGPWPPKVGQATNFTIHWIVKNFSTDVNNVNIRAFLGNNVKMTGVVKSNAATKPTYNERTQEVIWQIPRISAGKGIVNTPPEAVFQVEAAPSVNQAGQPMILLRSTSYEATDEFTSEPLRGAAGEVTTVNLDDPTVRSDEGRVVE